jgi:hypothetical protein
MGDMGTIGMKTIERWRGLATVALTVTTLAGCVATVESEEGETSELFEAESTEGDTASRRVSEEVQGSQSELDEEGELAGASCGFISCGMSPSHISVSCFGGSVQNSAISKQEVRRWTDSTGTWVEYNVNARWNCVETSGGLGRRQTANCFDSNYCLYSAGGGGGGGGDDGGGGGRCRTCTE